MYFLHITINNMIIKIKSGYIYALIIYNLISTPCEEMKEDLFVLMFWIFLLLLKVFFNLVNDVLEFVLVGS